MEFLVVAIIAAVCGGIVAGNKNRNVAGWAVLCFLIPLCLLIILFLSKLPASQGMEEATLPTQDDSKICPFCAETIKRAAVVCKHCGRDLPAEQEAVQPVDVIR